MYVYTGCFFFHDPIANSRIVRFRGMAPTGKMFHMCVLKTIYADKRTL